MLRSRLGSEHGAELAEHAEALILTTVEELRRVARGIYPAVLADAGLAGAVLDLAESSTDLPVLLDALPDTRYTGPVETTAYLVVAAAVADARQSGATQVHVSGVEREGRLHVQVRIDVPLPSHPSVTLLDDQVRAISGEIAVHTDGGDTMVRLELPCAS